MIDTEDYKYIDVDYLHHTAEAVQVLSSDGGTHWIPLSAIRDCPELSGLHEYTELELEVEAWKITELELDSF